MKNIALVGDFSTTRFMRESDPYLVTTEADACREP